MSALRDLLGQKFNSLTVVGRYFGEIPGLRPNDKNARWECLCDCGGTRIVTSARLIGGLVKSCGCRKNKRRTTHGMSRTTEYHIWALMRDRCCNITGRAFKFHGARGITVCERWDSSFQNFFDDMGPRPEGTTLERIDNDKGYSPDNCTWASMKEQSRNRRSNVYVTLWGEKMVLADLAKRLGIFRALVSKWHKRGWSAEQIYEYYSGRSKA
jgi:hypothetical protein